MIIQIIFYAVLVLWMLYTEKKTNDAEQKVLNNVGKLLDKLEKGCK